MSDSSYCLVRETACWLVFRIVSYFAFRTVFSAPCTYEVSDLGHGLFLLNLPCTVSYSVQVRRDCEIRQSAASDGGENTFTFSPSPQRPKAGGGTDVISPKSCSWESFLWKPNLRPGDFHQTYCTRAAPEHHTQCVDKLKTPAGFPVFIAVKCHIVHALLYGSFW